MTAQSANTCHGCPYHKRTSLGRDHSDWCYVDPGKPALRKRERGYWPDFPPMCDRKPASGGDAA